MDNRTIGFFLAIGAIMFMWMALDIGRKQFPTEPFRDWVEAGGMFTLLFLAVGIVPFFSPPSTLPLISNGICCTYAAWLAGSMGLMSYISDRRLWAFETRRMVLTSTVLFPISVPFFAYWYSRNRRAI